MNKRKTILLLLFFLMPCVSVFAQMTELSLLESLAQGLPTTGGDETKLADDEADDETDAAQDSKKKLESTFKDRFSYLQSDSQNLNLDPVYDLIFLDGDHTLKGLQRDVEMSLRLKPKYLVFDDYFHGDHHEDMRKVIETFNLQIIKVYRTHQGQALVKIAS